ncbi:MAG TPA: hypothetical protein VL242_48700, partial [Sorangium sp.]|nr:hypothetical protein [Sorangium sp.]
MNSGVKQTARRDTWIRNVHAPRVPAGAAGAAGAVRGARCAVRDRRPSAGAIVDLSAGSAGWRPASPPAAMARRARWGA